MKRILVVYHSLTGGSLQMARAAADGQPSKELERLVAEAYYAALDKVNGRPYATLICAGSDGRGAARQIERIVTGWRLKSIAEPMIVCTHAQSPEAILQAKLIGAAELASCAEIGAALAAGLVLGVF